MLIQLEDSRVLVRDRFEYEVGARVLYKVSVNNGGHHAPGAKIAGEVICVFPNGGAFCYRIRLDERWNGTVPGCRIEQIVVGNVTVDELSCED